MTLFTRFTSDKLRQISSYGAILVLALAFLLSCAIPSEAGLATLYRGDEALGQVPVRNSQNGFVVSVADAGALLGLSASVVGEELVLSRGDDRVRVVLNAVVAWNNYQLVPLSGASYVQDGRWWLNIPSSLRLLQPFAGRENMLRVEAVDGTMPATPPTVAAAPAPVAPAPAPVASAPAPAAAIPDAWRQLGPSGETQTPAPAPVSDTEAVERSDRVVVVSGSEVASLPSQPSTEPTPAAQTIQASAASFLAAPGVSDAPGELRAVRWSASREKIRMVLDSSDGTNPEDRLVSGRIAIPFASAVDNLRGVPSPYENVTAELVRNADGSATLFVSASGVRVQRLVLDNPRRIVFDFIFTVPTVVREVSQPQPVVAQAPVTPAVAPPIRAGGRRLVVLDPGHGGRDPGAVANGLRESDINLAVSLKMERALQNRGIEVQMTRRTDTDLRLRDRTEFANRANADMFVSVHTNALPPGRQAAGFEIYVMAEPTDADAMALARRENRELDDTDGGAAADRRTELLLMILGDMQQNLTLVESTAVAEVLFRAGERNGLPMRRVAQAPFYVLRGAAMPAVLLELGFITNPAEARLLGDPRYQQRLADAMAEGIYNYFARL